MCRWQGDLAPADLTSSKVATAPMHLNEGLI